MYIMLSKTIQFSFGTASASNFNPVLPTHIEMEVKVESPLRSQQNSLQPNTTDEDDRQKSKALERSLLALNFVIMIVGACSGPLLLRLYVVEGGNRKWLASWLQTAGWPILLIPTIVCRYYRQKTNSTQNLTPNTKPYLMTPPLFLGSTVIGIIIGLNCFFFAYGNSYLPVSTTTLLTSTQLGFTAFFAFVMVKQKFNAYTINAVVLLSLGAVVLGIHSEGDRPKGERKGMYYLGFVMMLGAAGTFGLALPLMEWSQRKAKVAMSYTLVLEMQLVIAFVANMFCTVGMVVNKDFQAIAREAKKYELGEARYYVVLVWTAIMWQLSGLGIVGSIFYTSSLLVGIIQAALIPGIQVLALIFFHDPFNGDKGVALGLSLWGSASYFYGEYKAKQDCKPAN